MTSTSLFHASGIDRVQEVETFSKPGTADVTAGDRAKLAGLLKHYRAQAKPFTACKRDQMKHGLSEDHANRRCAVIKDLIEGKTGWRGKAKEAAAEVIAEALDLIQMFGRAAGPPQLAEVLQEGDLSVEERAAKYPELTAAEAAEIAELELEVQTAAQLVEAAPTWMIPVAARQPGFKPIKPPKASTSSSSSYDPRKHPRAAAGSPGGGKFIRSGASGNEVTAIQHRLGIARTGTFGGKTKKAVEAFQKRKGIQVDGVIGTQTVAALRGTTTGVAPGALSKNDRRFLRRYARRT